MHILWIEGLLFKQKKKFKKQLMKNIRTHPFLTFAHMNIANTFFSELFIIPWTRSKFSRRIKLLSLIFRRSQSSYGVSTRDKNFNVSSDGIKAGDMKGKPPEKSRNPLKKGRDMSRKVRTVRDATRSFILTSPLAMDKNHPLSLFDLVGKRLPTDSFSP